MHVAHADEWRGLADWIVEMRASECVCDLAEARELPELDVVEWRLGKGLASYLIHAVDSGIATREQIREESARPALLDSYAGQWLRVMPPSQTRNGHRAVDDDELRAWLAGPAI